VRARELTVEEAEQPLGWLYPEPFSTYDAEGVLDPEHGFFAVEEDGELVGYGVTGQEARVPGVDEEAGTIDVGYGMRPDLIGRGRGRAFVGAILEFAVATDPAAARLRKSILDWNVRSRRVAEAHGFRFLERVGEFDVLVREAAAAAQG
jgi:[ribosomal protein S18]-alanine N-acetyltransferase